MISGFLPLRVQSRSVLSAVGYKLLLCNEKKKKKESVFLVGVCVFEKTMSPSTAADLQKALKERFAFRFPKFVHFSKWVTSSHVQGQLSGP